MWGCSSIGRALRSQCRGRGSESHHLHHFKDRLPRKPWPRMRSVKRGLWRRPRTTIHDPRSTLFLRPARQLPRALAVDVCRLGLGVVGDASDDDGGLDVAVNPLLACGHGGHDAFRVKARCVQAQAGWGYGGYGDRLCIYSPKSPFPCPTQPSAPCSSSTAASVLVK